MTKLTVMSKLGKYQVPADCIDNTKATSTPSTTTQNCRTSLYHNSHAPPSNPHLAWHIGQCNIPSEL